MAEIQQEGRRLHRLMGRGRDEAAPFYVHLSVLLVVAVAVGVVAGISFAIYYLA
jgi:hypothetical protein